MRLLTLSYEKSEWPWCEMDKGRRRPSVEISPLDEQNESFA